MKEDKPNKSRQPKKPHQNNTWNSAIRTCACTNHLTHTAIKY